MGDVGGLIEIGDAFYKDSVDVGQQDGLSTTRQFEVGVFVEIRFVLPPAVNILPSIEIEQASGSSWTVN